MATIIVIDDELDVLQMLRRLLGALAPAHTIIATRDPHQVLARLTIERVALLLADHNMPEMDGITLIKEARRISPHTTMLLITAYHTPLLERTARSVADGYLAKPFDIDDLEALVQQALGAADA